MARDAPAHSAVVQGALACMLTAPPPLVRRVWPPRFAVDTGWGLQPWADQSASPPDRLQLGQAGCALSASSQGPYGCRVPFLYSTHTLPGNWDFAHCECPGVQAWERLAPWWSTRCRTAATLLRSALPRIQHLRLLRLRSSTLVRTCAARSCCTLDLQMDSAFPVRAALAARARG